jgi:hypothetical protein
MVGLATHFNTFPCFYFIIFWLEAGARRGPVLYFCLLSSFVHSFTHMSDVAVRCSCGKDAGTHCLKEPKLCGNCCWPRCAEDSHGSGRRGTKRGSAGNKSAKDKRRTYRNESWMDASLIADVVQANPETMGYVRRSGYTIAQLTHKLWYLLQQPVGETFVSLELINKFPPNASTCSSTRVEIAVSAMSTSRSTSRTSTATGSSTQCPRRSSSSSTIGARRVQRGDACSIGVTLWSWISTIRASHTCALRGGTTSIARSAYALEAGQVTPLRALSKTALLTWSTGSANPSISSTSCRATADSATWVQRYPFAIRLTLSTLTTDCDLRPNTLTASCRLGTRLTPSTSQLNILRRSRSSETHSILRRRLRNIELACGGRTHQPRIRNRVYRSVFAPTLEVGIGDGVYDS